MSFIDQLAAPKGSTGNNTHLQVALPDVYESVCLQFVAEAVGATPTVTWKFQGSNEDIAVSDANSTWQDVVYLTPASGTAEASTARTVTAVGSDPVWLARGGGARFWKKVRLVTSANTNVTYRAEVISFNSES